MSQQLNGNPKTGSLRVPSELPACRDVPMVDCSGLSRAIDLMEQGQLTGDSIVALLRHELVSVQNQAKATDELLQRSLVETRQLRESVRQELVQKQDEQRLLEEQNDRFVASLIRDHEAELVALRRERDAAIDRVRELSRDVTRVGAATSASPPRLSGGVELRSPSGAPPIAELRARIDELLVERDRSLRLLRQLAEQRDLAESRLSSGNTPSLGPAPGERRAPHAAAMPRNTREPVLRSSEPQPYLAVETPRSTRELVVRSTARPAHTVNSTEASDVSPNAGPPPRAEQWELSELNRPENWDPPHSAMAAEPGPRHPSVSTSRSGAVDAHPADAGSPLSTSRRAATGKLEHAGAYSMHSEEIVAQEVVVFRDPKVDPKRP